MHLFSTPHAKSFSQSLSIDDFTVYLDLNTIFLTVHCQTSCVRLCGYFSGSSRSQSWFNKSVSNYLSVQCLQNDCWREKERKYGEDGSGRVGGEERENKVSNRRVKGKRWEEMRCHGKKILQHWTKKEIHPFIHASWEKIMKMCGSGDTRWSHLSLSIWTHLLRLSPLSVCLTDSKTHRV